MPMLPPTLGHKNAGPWRITIIVDNNSYELELLDVAAGVCPIFHPWELHLAQEALIICMITDVDDDEPHEELDIKSTLKGMLYPSFFYGIMAL